MKRKNTDFFLPPLFVLLIFSPFFFFFQRKEFYQSQRAVIRRKIDAESVSLAVAVALFRRLGCSF